MWGTIATTFDNEQDDFTVEAGGFLNFSGYDRDALEGRHLGIVRGLYFKRLRGQSLNNFADVPVYLGASLEYGGVWSDRKDISSSNAILAGSLFLGVNSIIGPVFLGVGYADGGHTAMHLSIGRPFIYDLSSTFE